jgi:hypothetical protein
MRKLLLSAAAAAPLLLFGPGIALADTTVESTSSPVQTSTVNNGQPDNVIVDSGATVNVNGPVAVTLNSSNSVTNNGTIQIENVDNSTAVQLNGGNTGSFINNSAVTNSESYTRTDTNDDGYVDGAYAQGTGRYGVHLSGSAPLVGDITLNTGSTITVQGNDSYGLAIDAPLQGDLTQDGSISVQGDNTYGLSITGPVSGKVFIDGTISASGTAATGVYTSGTVTGSLSIYSSITTTGYSSTVSPGVPSVISAMLPSDFQISGSAVQIGGNVQGGVFIGAPPVGTVSTDTTDDLDGDGIVDSAEGTSLLTTYGTAPALVIGSNTQNVHLGEYGTGNTAYGLIIEGDVEGTGVYSGYSGTGIQIGIANSPYQVNIDGGIHVASSSTISGAGFNDPGMGMHLLAGVSTPLLQNDGSISGTSTSTNTSVATGLQIDKGGSLQSIVNTGTISSLITGTTGVSTAILDQSGTVTSITNTNTITATITPPVDSDTVTGTTTAIDLRANTTGVTLTQNAYVEPTTESGVSTTVVTPTITGDIYLGTGDDTVAFNAGTVQGALNMGYGSISITGGASYVGALSVTGPISLNVADGSFQDNATNTVPVTNLTVGSTGQLIVSVDPANNAATEFNVSGQASFASGATMSLKVLSLINTPQVFTIVNAPGGLTVGSGATLTASTPYLFVAQFVPDTTNGTVTLDVRRRLASEADLNAAETAAWDPVYANLGLNSGIESAFLAQTTETGYRSMLNQILPDYAGGVFRALSWANEQQGDAAADPPQGEDQDGPTRAWSQEIVLDEDKSVGQTEPYHMLGVGVVAGLESVSPTGDALGMKIGFVTANIVDPDSPGDNLLGVSEFDTGVYWRGNFGGFRADAQLNAGFMWADDHREFLYSDTAGVVHDTALSDWMGYTLSGRFGLAYTANFGPFFLEPEVHADYFRMHEAGYSEHGGGTGFDMEVDPRNGDILTVTSSMVAGWNFGASGGFHWRPQVEVGYRYVPFGDAGSTTTEFIGGTDPFTLLAETVKMNSMIARVGMRVYSDYVDVLLDGGVEKGTDYTDLDVHLTARTVF